MTGERRIARQQPKIMITTSASIQKENKVSTCAAAESEAQTQHGCKRTIGTKCRGDTSPLDSGFYQSSSQNVKTVIKVGSFLKGGLWDNDFGSPGG